METQWLLHKTTSCVATEVTEIYIKVERTDQDNIVNNSNLPGQLSDFDQAQPLTLSNERIESDFNQTHEKLEEAVSWYNYLISHKTEHSGIKKYTCFECGKQFKRATNLKRHAATHKESKDISCEFCRKQFYHKNNLSIHMIVHTGEKRYDCDICGQLFLRKSDLKKHLRTHIGSKDFCCDICKRQYKQRSHLKRHMQVHSIKKDEIEDETVTSGLTLDLSIREVEELLNYQDNSEPLPFRDDNQAKISDDSTKGILLGSKVLSSSIKKAEDFACNVCNKSFQNRSNMKKHMTLHSGHKDFLCQLCGKRFAQRWGLKSHMMSHTAEKNFKCDVCEVSFGRRSDMKKHMARKTCHLKKVCTNMKSAAYSLAMM